MTRKSECPNGQKHIVPAYFSIDMLALTGKCDLRKFPVREKISIEQ